MLSFRTRLALAHQTAIVVVLALTALGGYWSLSRAVHDQLDAALLALAETELGMLQASGDQPVRVHEATPGPAPPSFERLDRLVQIVDADGQVVARSANLGAARLPSPPDLLARMARGEIVFETLPGYGSEPTRIVSVPVEGHGRLRAIQVAGSLDDVNHVVRSASELFVGTGVALLIVVSAAGALLTRRVFGTIDDMVQQVRRIGQSDLGRRLLHPGTNDEIGRLVETLNDMLARIEHSFEAQRRFTADASHELRSPLSRLRTELEVTLRRPRDTAEYIETLRSCVEEVERLTVLVEELLVLARLDADQESAPAEAVPLRSMAEGAMERMRAAASEREVALELGHGAEVHAKVGRGAAGLVLANLLDNAIKFSPRGGRVCVRVGGNESEAVVSVSDNGPGVAVSELPYLFERFYRGSAARTGVPGHGLGLAVTQAIVRAHGGRIGARTPDEGGACFTVTLPRAAAGDD